MRHLILSNRIYNFPSCWPRFDRKRKEYFFSHCAAGNPSPLKLTTVALCIFEPEPHSSTRLLATNATFLKS